MSISSEDVLRLLASILSILLPVAIGRRKLLGKALVRAGTMIDRVEKEQPREDNSLPLAMSSQGIALKAVDERIDMINERMRRGLDGLQQQINEERTQRRTEYAGIKEGMNNLSVRVYTLEHPKSQSTPDEPS